MRAYSPHVRSQQGLTLIEIMIALLIGAFLLGGVLQVFSNTRQTYRVQDNMSRLQENARLAMEFLSFDVRMAGFFGCPSLASIAPNVIAAPKNPNPNQGIAPISFTIGQLVTGANNVANNWNSTACSASNLCKTGSDTITLQFAGSCGAHLIGNVDPVNANIQVPATNTCNLQQYDVLLISDCVNADVFVASNVINGATIQTVTYGAGQNTVPKLSKDYSSNAELFQFHSYTYYIRTGNSGLPALWRVDNSKVANSTNPIELVEGVEDMQINYGADTDADGVPNYYVPAGTAGLDLTRVSGVRISLLMTTLEDGLAATPASYAYNGTTTTPGDKRIRRVFTSTIGLRNEG